MAREFKDRVQDTTATAGTGPFTLDAATIAGFRSFGSAHTVGAALEYFVSLGSDWEVGLGTLTDATHLARTTILASSNGGAVVNFGAGSKTIFETVSGVSIARMLTANDVAFSQSVPLSIPGSSYMPQTTVAGPLTITPAAKAGRGAVVYLRLKANGANIPEFSGFKKWPGSDDYDNTVDALNIAQFMCDGVDSWYAIASAAAAASQPAADTTAPTLSNPTSTSTGTTTGSGAVTTNEGNGTLYYMVSSNATETAATVKAGSTQAVTSAGSKAVTFSGLTAAATYYLHFLHRDAAGNDSTVANSASFTTSAAGDTTAPTLSSPTGTQTGDTTASGTVSTNEANGTLFYLATVNAVESAATVKAGASKAVTATGVQNVSFTGLTASTTYYAHFVHRDAAGNDSVVANSASFTTAAAAAAGYTIAAYQGNGPVSAVDGSGTNVQRDGGFAYLDANKWGTAGNNIYVISPKPASVQCGWSNSNTTPPTTTGNYHANGWSNANDYGGNNWQCLNYLWVPAGTSTWYLWIKPVDGPAVCVNPSGLVVSNVA